MADTAAIPSRILPLRSGNMLTLILGTERITREGDEDEIRRIYNAALAVKQTRKQSDWEILQDLLNPSYRVLLDGDIEINEQTGQLFLKGSSVPIPETLSKTIQDFIGDKLPFQALVNFWKLSLLNPDDRARNAFLEYVEKYGVTITDNGYAVLYKAVTHKKEKAPAYSEDLQAFVSREIIAAKRKKKGAARFTVYRATEEFTLESNNTSYEKGLFVSEKDQFAGYPVEVVGNLKELHDNVGTMEVKTVFTDKHTRTMDIKLGEPVVKKRSECDSDPSRGCSRGLHVGAFEYVRGFTSHGDSVFATLVNPMNVVAVPTYNKSKMRVCEYYPYALMEVEGRVWKELESPYFESNYINYEFEEIEARLRELQYEVETDSKVATKLFAKEAAEIAEQRLIVIPTPEVDLPRQEFETLEDQGLDPECEEGTLPSNDPYTEGRMAYSDDKSLDDNPHPKHTVAFSQWQEGFIYTEENDPLRLDDEDDEEWDDDDE